jgi:hypothetical protein
MPSPQFNLSDWLFFLSLLASARTNVRVARAPGCDARHDRGELPRHGAAALETVVVCVINERYTNTLSLFFYVLSIVQGMQQALCRAHVQDRSKPGAQVLGLSRQQGEEL